MRYDDAYRIAITESANEVNSLCRQAGRKRWTEQDKALAAQLFNNIMKALGWTAGVMVAGVMTSNPKD